MSVNKLPVLIKVQVVIAIVAVAVTIAAIVIVVPLMEKATELQTEVSSLTAKRAELQHSVDQLIQEYNKARESRIAQQLQPRASATKLDARINPDGKQVYIFRAWLDMPPALADSVERVEYLFDHPSFGDHKKIISSDRKSDFAVAYTGWGCLSAVKVEVFFKDQTTTKLYFDMCAIKTDN